MAEGFRERARAVKELLADDGTTFLLVTSPAHEAVAEALFFRDKLAEDSMPFGGVIVNRMHVEGSEEIEPGLDEALGEELAAKVVANFEDFRALSLRDRDNVAELADGIGDRPLIVVPYLDDDVHDLGGLALMNEHLFA